MIVKLFLCSFSKMKITLEDFFCSFCHDDDNDDVIVVFGCDEPPDQTDQPDCDLLDLLCYHVENDKTTMTRK